MSPRHYSKLRMNKYMSHPHYYDTEEFRIELKISQKLSKIKSFFKRKK
jgi:hypothetical protein